MSAKNYVKFVFLMIIVVTCAFVMFNYVTDRTGIVNGENELYRTRQASLNQHFVKVRYVLNNPEKYNAFCFGSSRVGHIDLHKINNGLRWYNMTYSSGLPAEWCEDIKILLKRGVSIKSIILGVDEFDMTDSPVPHEKQFERIPYKEDDYRAYFSILFRVPKLDNVIMKENKYAVYYDIYDSGRTLNPAKDAWIESNVVRHLGDNAFSIVALGMGFFNNEYDMNSAVRDLKEIKDLCQENGIEMIVIFHPTFYYTYYAYEAVRPSEINDFKRCIAEVTPFYDFSGLNRITTDKYYYYEANHFRPIVGDMMIKRIFAPEQAPKDFGVYVTKDNIDAHISNLEKQIDEYAAY